MSEETLFGLLKILNIPVAYDHFIETGESSVNPPFILYRNTDTTTIKADDKVVSTHNQYLVDLVTSKKNTQLEKELEEIFSDNNMPYDKTEDYIFDENIFQIRYYL